MSERDLEATLRTALADRYTVERALGAGGMAIVFLARGLRHDRPVALKVLRPELAAALGPERFLREIQIAARLHHPHILPLYDSGSADGLLFYVMPFVEGESLRDRLDRERFERAIARDSGFAQAWAGLADTYALVPFYRGQDIPRDEAYRRAEVAARRAIALAPDLAEAHASLAFALVYGPWDLDAAEREYLRALELDPDYPVAHYWYVELLIIEGRLSDALAHAERAVALAPAAPIAHHLLGVAAYYIGDHELAVREDRMAALRARYALPD